MYFSLFSANGTPSSKSLVQTFEKSLKKSSLSLAYFSTHDLKALSETRATSVGSIIKDLVVLSSNCCMSIFALPLMLDTTHLLRTVPLLVLPLLVQQELVVVVGDNCWRERPWSRESTSVCVAAAQGVSTAQGDDLLVVEAHSAEDIAQMLVALRSVWETSIRCAECNIPILSAWSVWHDWALHFLDCADS